MVIRCYYIYCIDACLQLITLQCLMDLIGQVIQFLHTFPQVERRGLPRPPPALPLHQHLQLLHGHVFLCCLDVVQFPGVQVEIDGHLLPLLPEPLGHLQELLL